MNQVYKIFCKDSASFSNQKIGENGLDEFGPSGNDSKDISMLYRPEATRNHAKILVRALPQK